MARQGRVASEDVSRRAGVAPPAGSTAPVTAAVTPTVSGGVADGSVAVGVAPAAKSVERDVAATARLPEEFIARIRAHTARVGVVGLGYVGLPFAVKKAKVGFAVTGIEQNPLRAAAINRDENYIPDVRDEELAALVRDGRLRAVTTFDVVPELDVIVICVPTPLTKNLTPDLQFVENVTREIARRLGPGQLISLESTTYPGTTDGVMRPILEASGLKAGVDFFLAHSSERVDPGNKRYTTKNTNKVVGTSDPASREVALAFYLQTIQDVVPVSSAAAELVKVFENTFRAVNMGSAEEPTRFPEVAT